MSISHCGYTIEVICVLATTREHEFTLTGSHFFGASTRGSDYDFFVDDSKEVRAFLQDLGFIDITSNYKDKLTVSVYRHFEAEVDVQLVRNAALKSKVQQVIRAVGSTPPRTGTSAAINFWNRWIGAFS